MNQQNFELYKDWRDKGDIQAYSRLLELGFEIIQQNRKLYEENPNDGDWQDTLDITEAEEVLGA